MFTWERMKIFHIFQCVFFVLTFFVLSTSGGRKISRACDGEHIQLKCNDNEHIKVRSVFFGRTEKNFCNKFLAINLKPFENCQFANETQALKSTAEKCDNRTICEFNATRTFYGGNCPRNAGYLEVVYDCKELLTVKTVKCEGRNMTLMCPDNYEIEIVQALYGRLMRDKACLQAEDIPANCVSPIAFDKVSGMCNGKKECGIRALSSIFGNPCPSSRKYLSVVHRCRPTMYRREVVCEGDGNVILQCPPGQFINLERVDYGRKNPYECPFGVVSLNETAKKCSTPFGTEISKMRCNGREMCSIKADSVFFGDPCPGITKYVEATYRCQSIPTRKEEACIGSMFDMKCPDGLNMEVTSAYFGRVNQGICHEDKTVDSVCYSPQSQAIVSGMCNGRNNCKSQVSDTFGLPCPRSSSYLEVNYVCLKNEHLTSLACEGEDLLISCPIGFYIEVEDALFGRGDDFFCPHGPITHTLCYNPVKEYVKTLCDDSRLCTVPASSTLFGKPCGNTTTYLEVKYSCHKWKPLYEVACEGSKINLICPPTKRLKILDANYGRRESTLCRGPNLEDFVSSCYSESAKRIVEDRCSAFNNCTLYAGTRTFDDPCFNTPKYLDVTYACISYINY